MLTTVTTTIWFQKAKLAADAIWGVTSLFCVPGVVFASVCMFVPVRTTGKYVWDIRSVVASQKQQAPHDYQPPAGMGGPLAYRLGLFDAQGRLVHAYPDQVITQERDASQGSIVVEVPHDVPPGSYSLRVFRSEGLQVREVPVRVGEQNVRSE